MHTGPVPSPPDGQGQQGAGQEQGQGGAEAGRAVDQSHLAPSPLTLLRDVGRYVRDMVEAAAAGVSVVHRAQGVIDVMSKTICKWQVAMLPL